MTLKFFKNINSFLESKLYEENSVAPASTSGHPQDATKIDELQKQLIQWSESFGGMFKFKFDHPKKGDAELAKFNKSIDYISKLKNEIETPEGISDNYPDKAIESVKKLAELLNTGNYKEVPVYVIGHCSSPGSDEYNLDLSGRRARLVKYALLKLIDSTKYNINKLLAKSDGEKKLIITNDGRDQDGKEATFNTGVDTEKLINALGKENLSKFSVKSLINQRVQVSVKYPAEIVTPEPDKMDVNEQPKEEKVKSDTSLLIDPTALDFLPDSYLIKTESIENILKPFADKINKAGDSVKSIVVIGHAENAGDKKQYDEVDELKGLYVLSLNRSVAVREKLEGMITVKDIKYLNYGCGIELSDDYTDFEKAYKDTPRPSGNKVVEVFVNFDPKKSKEVYDKLKEEYNVGTSQNIINNDSLLRVKLWNIYMKVYGTEESEILKNIPLEFRKETVNPHIQEAIDSLPGYLAKIDNGELKINVYKKEIIDKIAKIDSGNFDKLEAENDKKGKKKKKDNA